MRTFLLTIFWLTNIGGVIQLIVIACGIWIVSAGTYSWLQLDVDTFITQFVPWLLWGKALIISLLGDLGRLILGIPILILSPFKLVTGLIIGFWAYSVAKKMADPEYGTDLRTNMEQMRKDAPFKKE